jgi:hypothetical protein
MQQQTIIVMMIKKKMTIAATIPADADFYLAI